jgi:predicted nucleotidyltransferase
MDRTIHKNGLIKNELSLLLPFVKEPWREFTLTEIKKITKKTSHHYVFEALKKFSKSGILLEKRKGNTNIYAINPDNHDVHYLVLAESIRKEQRKDIPYKNIKQVTDKIKSPYYTFIIGGSYAIGKQKPTSDLDVGIIIPDSEDKKPFEIALKEGRLMIPEIHGFVFTKEEFYLMLVNDEFNFGKELARKHILFYGGEQYYKILFEAMKHGFKG